MAATVPLRLARSDPLPSEPSRFVVGGQAGNGSGDVKLYEWHRQRGDMRLVGLQTDVGQIKALEWSPSPVHRHLVALGQSTGRTILLSLTAKTLSLPLSNHSAAAALPAATVSILPIKHTRAVTALSFCPADPNYLATGYERHRSDYSLLIWDLSTSLASLPPDGNANWQRPLDRLEVTNPTARDATRLNPSEPRHIQHYCPSEHVNSLAFLPTGQQLLASANNKVIRLYDLRTPGPTQNAPPKDPSTALTAGASLQWHTRAVSSLLPDPLHASRFASFEASPGGSASSVRLWDSRKPNVEVLSFDVRGAVLGMEWLQVTNSVARLGVGTREGVAIWDIVSGTTVDEEHVEEWVTIGGLRNVVKPKQPLHSFAFANSVDEHRSDVMFVVKDGTIGIGPITPPPVVASGSRGDVVFSARDLRTMDPDTPVPSVRDGPSRPQDKDDDGRSDASGDEEAEFSRTNRFQLQPHRITTILEEASRSRPNSRASSIHRGMIPEKGNRGWEHPTPRFDENFRDGGDIGWNGWMRTLRSDVGCVMRQRAEEGYGTSNLLLNAAIATRYPGHERLAGIWEFINRKSNNGNKSLRTDLTHTMDATTSSTRSVNLTYAGIHSIWTGQDLHHQSPDSPSSTASLRSHSTALNEATRAPREVVKQGSAAWTSLRNTQMPNRAQSTPASSTTSLGRLDTPEEKEPVLPQADFASAVEIINGKREAEDHPGHVGTSKLPRTERTAQRKMILAVCGEMDAGNVNRSMEEEERTKAASWAYFSGEEENAVRILMNSNNSKHRLLGTTLAGFLSQSRATRANEFFDEHWRSLTNRVDDPYIRAVLSRVGGDGWESVLEEEAMPLLDRIAIAVCNLPDDELGAFLKNRLARFSRNPSPSLSSLSLTGFTSPAITFMQRWLERTGDVQTVALLSAYFPQSRLTYRECQMVKKWVEGYRDLLDGWGMWGERVEFDVGRMEIGRGLGEDRRSDDDGTGGVGTCPLCNNTLSKVHKEHLQLKSGLTRERSAPNERTGACTLCGQTLPRCVICLRHVESKSYTGHRDEFDFDDNTPSLTDTIDQAYVCCLTCRHGGHANHIVPWFQGGLDGEPGHDTCPVAGCPCECANI